MTLLQLSTSQFPDVFDPRLFTGVGTPMLLLSVYYFAQRPDRRERALKVAIAGGVLFLIAGTLYRDLAMVLMEVVFVGLNTSGLLKAVRERVAAESRAQVAE